MVILVIRALVQENLINLVRAVGVTVDGDIGANADVLRRYVPK